MRKNLLGTVDQWNSVQCTVYSVQCTVLTRWYEDRDWALDRKVTSFDS